MKKIIFAFSLVLLLVGCSNGQTSPDLSSVKETSTTTATIENEEQLPADDGLEVAGLVFPAEFHCELVSETPSETEDGFDSYFVSALDGKFTILVRATDSSKSKDELINDAVDYYRIYWLLDNGYSWEDSKKTEMPYETEYAGIFDLATISYENKKAFSAVAWTGKKYYNIQTTDEDASDQYEDFKNIITKIH